MRRRLSPILVLATITISVLLAAALASAQGIITTVAGNPDTPLRLGKLTGGIAADAVGNFYIADTESHRLLKISSQLESHHCCWPRMYRLCTRRIHVRGRILR